MSRSCFLLLLAASIYLDLADCDFDLSGEETKEGLDDDDMVEKILEPLHTNLDQKSQDKGGNIHAKIVLDAMTPPEVHQMETDNTLDDDGYEPSPELLQYINEEWKKLILLHNPDYIVNKFTENCIYVFKQDGKSKTVVGREATKEMYQTWFDTYGQFSLEIVPDTVKAGRLGLGYLWLNNYVKFYKENGDFAGATTNTVIFKHIPASESVNGKGGLEVMLVSEVRDD